MKNWFEGINTREALKAEYKRLAKLHHPDLGGDNATMAEINAQFDELDALLKSGRNPEAAQDAAGNDSESFRAAVVAVQNMAGVELELCGSWLWATGSTREYKEFLKAAGYRWSSNKGAWYWHEGEYRRRGHKVSLDYIRGKYGTKSVSFAGMDELTA